MRLNVLIDLDGTLTDPATGICASLRHALSAMGRVCPSDVELQQYIGPPLQQTLCALLGSGEREHIEKGIQLYRERYSATGLFENTVYPGIPAALAALTERGATLIVATSKPQVFADRILDHFGLARHFKAVYGSELDGARSDKTELIAHVLQAEAIPAASASMVGDRSHDVVGARANGVRAVGALWGYGSRDELLAAGAARLCEHPDELVRVLAGFGDSHAEP